MTMTLRVDLLGELGDLACHVYAAAARHVLVGGNSTCPASPSKWLSLWHDAPLPDFSPGLQFIYICSKFKVPLALKFYSKFSIYMYIDI